MKKWTTRVMMTRLFQDPPLPRITRVIFFSAIATCRSPHPLYMHTCFKQNQHVQPHVTYSAGKLSWTASEEFCQARNSTLAKIEKEAESDWLAERLVHRVGRFQFTWIGLRRLAPQQYRWTDGTPPSITRLSSVLEFLNGNCISLVANRRSWVRSNCDSSEIVTAEK